MDYLRRFQSFLFFSIIISMVVFFAGEWAYWQWIWQSLIVVLFISFLSEIFLKQSFIQFKDFILSWMIPMVFVLYALGQALLGPSEVLNTPGIGSVYSWATYQASFSMLLFILFGMSCCLLFRSRRFLDVFFPVLATIVFVIVVLSFMQALSVKTPILWRVFINDKRFFGPFFNQNHFGSFVILVLPMLLGYLHYQWLLWKEKIKNNMVEHFFLERSIEFMKSSFCFLLIVIVITFVMVFFSLGRWPFIILSLGCCLYLLILAFFRYRWLSLTLIGIIFSICLIYYQLMPKDFLGEHFIKGLKESTQSRLVAITQTIEFSKQRPFFGTGLGTFYFVSTKFIPQDHAILNHAHNDFVETWLETGFVGGILILIFIGICFKKGWNRFRKHRSRLLKILTLQAVVTLILFIVLEMGDYYIRNPLNALFLMMQISILFIPVDDEDLEERKTKSSFCHWKAWSVACSFLVVYYVGFFIYQQHAYATLMEKKDKTSVFELKNAVKKFPDSAQVWFLLAQAQLNATKKLKGPGAIFLTQPAVYSIQQAIKLSPTFAHYWYALALLETSLKKYQQAKSSITQACFWAPYSTKYLLLYKTLHLNN